MAGLLLEEETPKEMTLIGKETQDPGCVYSRRLTRCSFLCIED